MSYARGPPTGVVQTARRTWDEEEYRKKAEERAAREEGNKRPTGDYLPASEREALKARDEFYDFQSKVGKVTAVNAKDKSSGGFYCALCDVLLRDSLSYTNHVNGRKHLRKAGISEYTQKSTLDEVLAVLEFGRRKKYPERYISQIVSSALSTSKTQPKRTMTHDEEDESEMVSAPPPKRAKHEEYKETPESPPRQALPDRKIAGRRLMADEDED